MKSVESVESSDDFDVRTVTQEFRESTRGYE
jgi:hypothetical protein